jgi:hypothetical protein
MTPPTSSRCLKPGAVVAACFAMVGLVVAEPLRGQAAFDPHPTMEQLLRRLEERDALIADLQRRVEELERHIATTADRAPPVNEPRVAAQPVPSVPPVASSAQQAPSKRSVGMRNASDRQGRRRPVQGRTHQPRPQRRQRLKAAQCRQRQANSRSTRRRLSARWSGRWS